MVDADMSADTGAAHTRRVALPTNPAIARMEQGRVVLSALHERRTEARMYPEIHEGSARSEHAPGLTEHRLHIVEVRVRQDGDNGVKRSVVERKRMGVGVHEPDIIPGMSLRRLELVDRDVGPYDGPTGTNEWRNRPAGAAAEIKTVAGTPPEKLDGELPDD